MSKYPVSDHVMALNPGLSQYISSPNAPKVKPKQKPKEIGIKTRTKPVSIVIFGRPKTVNDAIAAAKINANAYTKLKEDVEAEVMYAMIQAGIGQGEAYFDGFVLVDIVVVYETGVRPDVDGVWIKPILDAMQGWLYDNDRVVIGYSVDLVFGTGEHTRTIVTVGPAKRDSAKQP